MKKFGWKPAALVGLVAVIIVLAVVLIVTGRDAEPSDDLPGIIVPSVQPATPVPQPSAQPTPEDTKPPAPERVTLIGDSIMVAAENALYEYIPNCVVNAKQGRQLVEAMDILYDMEAAGEIYDTVVIGLGSNSPFPIEEGERVLDFLGEDRTIYWVTCYGRYLDWQDETNDHLRPRRGVRQPARPELDRGRRGAQQLDSQRRRHTPHPRRHGRLRPLRRRGHRHRRQSVKKGLDGLFLQ